MDIMSETIRYTYAQFEEVRFQGFEHTTRKEVIDMISLLAEKVGAPSYVKTPVFEKRIDPRRKPKTNVISDEEWGVVRNFKASGVPTVGVNSEIESIRTLLNKVSEPTYENIKASMLAQIGILRNNSGNTEKMDVVADLVFDVASGNKFYSSLYADLYSSLCDNFGEFAEHIPNRFERFITSFSEIEVVDPDTDYDGFCKANLENDRRRAKALFFVNLMKRGLLSEFDVLVLVENLQDILLNTIDIGESGKAEEITECLLVIASSCRDQLRDTAAFPNILSKLQSVADSKPKARPGLNNKIVFKHMDILDLLK